MQPDAAGHRKGVLITALGGLALSIDIPLIRLAQGEIWSVLALRSLFTFVAALAIWLVLNVLLGRKTVLIPGRWGLIVGGLYATNSITFVLAIFYTSTANVVFILAFTSMFAALLSWVFLHERPSRATLITMAVMIAGVGLIVSDGLVSGNIFGDAMALLTSFVLAGALTASRASNRDMGLVPLVVSIVPAMVAFALLPSGGIVIAHPAFILANGLIIMPFAFFCLATGPRYLSAPEVGTFYLLETILAPVWVWLVFSETPTGLTLVGGGILVAALIGHSAWQMRQNALGSRSLAMCDE